MTDKKQGFMDEPLLKGSILGAPKKYFNIKKE